MDDPITTAEAAQLLHVSPSTVSRMVDRGQLEPAVKLPGLRGAFLFDRRDIEKVREAS